MEVLSYLFIATLGVVAGILSGIGGGGAGTLMIPAFILVGLPPQTAVATGKIGSTVITINYYSPAVRGRVIWGGLVPMDQVWVTGAHKATSIEFEGPIKIGGVDLPAGKYGLFTIPSKDEWIIIINKNWDQHLADDYDQKQDVVRVHLKPEREETNQERLRYVIESETNNTGEIVIYWENLEVSLPIIVPSN